MIPALIPSIAGAVVAGLTSFLASRGPAILAGLGLAYAGSKGLEALIGLVASQIMQAAGSVGGQYGASMVSMMAYAGFFDFINIVLSSYAALGAILGMRVLLRKL